MPPSFNPLDRELAWGGVGMGKGILPMGMAKSVKQPIVKCRVCGKVLKLKDAKVSRKYPPNVFLSCERCA